MGTSWFVTNEKNQCALLTVPKLSVYHFFYRVPSVHKWTQQPQHPHAFDAALRPNADTAIQVLMCLRKFKLYSLIYRIII